MGEKGMDTGGPGAQTSAGFAGSSIAQQMGEPIDDQPPPAQPAESSGPDAGEIVGDILDPLGLHKLFE